MKVYITCWHDKNINIVCKQIKTVISKAYVSHIGIHPMISAQHPRHYTLHIKQLGFFGKISIRSLRVDWTIEKQNQNLRNYSLFLWKLICDFCKKWISVIIPADLKAAIHLNSWEIFFVAKLLIFLTKTIAISS